MYPLPRLSARWSSLRGVGRFIIALALSVFCAVGVARANIPGGGTGTGANVTLTSTSTSATMSNGIVSISITKSSAQIPTINYTFNNNGSTQTLNLLSGNSNGGKLYWEHSNNQGLSFTYSVVVDPAANGGEYAEVSLYSTTQANMPMEVHYSMRRGSPGFYVAVIWTHDASNGAFGMGECRNNIYAGGIFNWMSVDATRNRLMQVTGGSSVGVPTAPVECSLWTSGLYQGQYEDKYKYSATFGDQRVWGWSSVGAGGKNVGLWNVSASAEYYNGGPLKPELMEHLGTTILNMFNGGHFGMGSDGTFVSGETWSKVCGPYLVYCNNIPSTVTDPEQAAQTLYNDALAQGTAEKSAWPYSWFSSPYYSGPANRGTVTGKIVINDPQNPNASAANLWVGVIQQPATSTGTYDFQQWMKPYQFWVHSDANGNFTIPAVIAGSNYTLYAFGPGAAGTFMSQPLSGGTPLVLEDIPASPFAVTVAAGGTTALGDVTWTPARVGPTVFELGYPDRTARKFKHGEDWWVSDIGPGPTNPSPVWSKWLEFPFDFPSGLNYVVGSHRWTTDWNFVQPVVNNAAGGWDSSSSTITFNLAAKPATGTQASIYLGIASDYYTALIITVNGTNLSGASGIVATPSSHPSTGFVPTSSKSDGTIREVINGSFSDERLTFAGTLLNAGANTIKITQRQVGGSYFADHAMYDYVRLELTGYIPPAPASVSAFAGNNLNLVSWPATSGATSYKVLRSIVSGSGYSVIAANVVGPACGNGLTNATYTDTTAANGTTYYYVVQSVNPGGTSANSAQSPGVTPSGGIATSAPVAPTGLSATGGGGSVTLNWTAASGANQYTVRRSTLTTNGVSTNIVLNTIPLANNITGTTYTDTSPTNGSTYSYTVSASNGVGESPVSGATTAIPKSTAPVSSTPVVTVTPGVQQVILNWTAVSGAVGYTIQVATSAGGPYTYLATVSALTYTDTGQADNTTYYYLVTASNSGGLSAVSTVAPATTAPLPPTGLAATPGNTQAAISWTASAGATSYVVQRSLTSGGPYTTVGTVSGTSFTNTGLTNGAVYYYVVAAKNGVAISPDSTETSVTPAASVPAAPTNLTLNSSSGQIVLSWTAPPGALSYIVQRSTVSGGPYATLASGITATTYTDTTAISATTYYYVVAAVNAFGTGANSSEASGTTGAPFLTWSGSVNSTWDTATANWLNGASSTYTDGAFVTFDNSSAITSVTLSGTLTPGSVTVNSSQNYTFSGGGSITGSTTLAKSGSGSLTLSTAHTYSGGTFITAGMVTLANTTANTDGLGSGPVTLNNGTLKLFSLGSSSTSAGTFDNDLQVDSGYTGTLIGFGRGTLAGALLGGGTLNYQTDYVRADVTGNWSGFTGQINVTKGANGGDFRINNTNGFGTAKINLGAGVTQYMQVNFGSTGLTNSIGELTGTGSLIGGPTGGRTMTWNVGGANTNAQFDGQIRDNAGPTALIKSGTGTWSLSGASTHTGATTVSAGSLLVTGSLGATAVSVSSGATLGGTGTFGGGLTLASGARLALGVGSSLTAGPTVSGTSTLNGAITVVPALLGGSLASGTYNLLAYSGTLLGSPTFTWSDTTGSGSVATFSTATAGLVKITVTLPPGVPSGLVATAGNAQVALTWNTAASAATYTVLRSTTSGSGYASIASNVASTSYADTGLNNGTTYYYVVRAVNLAGTSANSNQASATPVQPLSPIESWRVTHFGSSAATGDAANDADPDADGAVNLLEYALGGDPWLADASSILPTVAITSDRLALTFRRIADPSLTYTVQASSDLTATWDAIWSSTGADNTAAPVTVPDSDPLSDHPRRFLRLQVTTP